MTSGDLFNIRINARDTFLTTDDPYKIMHAVSFIVAFHNCPFFIMNDYHSTSFFFTSYSFEKVWQAQLWSTVKFHEFRPIFIA